MKVRGSSAFGFYLLAVAAGGVAVMADGVALAAWLWLLPSLGSLLLERERGRPMSRAMALFGVAASLPGLSRIWMEGGGLDAGLAVGFEPYAAGAAWTAQGAAWLLAEFFPILLILNAEWVARGSLRRLEADRRDLAEEWSST